MTGFGSRFRGKCFQGKKTAVTVRCSYAAVSSHVAATATYSYNCRLFAQEVLNPSKSRQTLSTPGLFLGTLFLLVGVLAFGGFGMGILFLLINYPVLCKDIDDPIRPNGSVLIMEKVPYIAAEDYTFDLTIYILHIG